MGCVVSSDDVPQRQASCCKVVEGDLVFNLYYFAGKHEVFKMHLLDFAFEHDSPTKGIVKFYNAQHLANELAKNNVNVDLFRSFKSGLWVSMEGLRVLTLGIPHTSRNAILSEADTYKNRMPIKLSEKVIDGLFKVAGILYVQTPTSDTFIVSIERPSTCSYMIYCPLYSLDYVLSKLSEYCERSVDFDDVTFNATELKARYLSEMPITKKYLTVMVPSEAQVYIEE